MTIWMLLWSMALGSEFYLEATYVESRTEVVRQHKAAEAAGFSASTVVRRFVEGQGWRFLVRADGYHDAVEAGAAAASLASALDVGVDILEREGASARFVRHHVPGADVPETFELLGIDPELGKAALAVLQRAVEAHGVDRSTLTTWMEGPAMAAYRRHLADGTVADHRWWTAQGASFVDVDLVEGEGRSSRMYARDGEAWLALDGGDWEKQDPERVRAVMRGFDPGAVIPVIFGLGHAMEGRRELMYLQYAGEGRVGDERTHVLGYGGDDTAGAMVLEVGASDALVRRASLAGGELIYEFDDYREVDGLKLPFRIVTRRGDDEDLVSVESLRRGRSLLSDEGAIAFADSDLPP